MAHKNHQPWSDEDLHRAVSMRRACVDPQLIGQTLGRTEANVGNKLSKTNIEFPALRRSNLKYDKAAVARWREMKRAGSSQRSISEAEGVHEVIISRTLAKDIYGELVY